MIEIHHGPEPEGLKQFRQDYIKKHGTVDSAAWVCFDKSATNAKRALIEELHSLQDGLCVYCEREIKRGTCQHD